MVTQSALEPMVLFSVDVCVILPPFVLSWFLRTFEAAGRVPSVMLQPKNRLPHAPTRGFGAPIFGLACY